MSNPENTGTKQAIPRNKKGQFPPGVSGNPAGKPVGTKHLSTKLYDALEKEIKDGQFKGKTYSSLLIDRILNDAIIKGNTTLISLIWGYIDGHPQQGIDITSNGNTVAPTADIQAIAQKVAKELKDKKTDGSIS